MIVLSHLDEIYLWSLGLLGWDNPENLLNTVVYLVRKGFALHAGKEHHVLRSPSLTRNSSFTMTTMVLCFFITKKM